jgi:nicotinamidase-related amidase
MAHPVVVVVDVQERLFNAVDAERRDDMVTNVKILVSAARRLGAEHVILTAIEAHVCVLLTALDLLTRGLRVSIVADAVCSRRPANLEIGLGQARQAGAVVTATETVVFQLLGSADSDAFRELSKLLR